MPFSHRTSVRFRLTGLVVTLALLLAAIAGLVWAGEALEIAGYHNFSYGDVVKDEPTAYGPESKLWWNHGHWWGVLWNPSASAYHIYRLDLPTQDWIDTGTVVDDRPDSRSDVLWDGSKLYVASHFKMENPGKNTNPDNWAYLHRYSYNAGSQSYTLDDGFPTIINEHKTETLVIDKDSTGRLWATFVSRELGGSIYSVYVTHSSDGGANWAAPFTLDQAGISPDRVQVDLDDISSLRSFETSGGQRVGVMWSNQAATNPLGSSFYIASHPVSADPQTNWTLETDLNAAFPYPGDDHISLATTPSGELLAAVKTGATGAADPLIAVISRNLGGDYDFDTVAPVETGDTRPALVVNGSTEEAYVFVTGQAGGSQICYRKSWISPLSAMDFSDANCRSPNEVLTLNLPDMASMIGSSTYDRASNATSTKQIANGASGIAVLGSDDGNALEPRSDYLHNVLGGAAPVDDQIYISSSSDGTAGGQTFADEDILRYDGSSNAWALIFDGSDVGLASTDVNAFTLLPDNSILLSFDSATFDLPGVGEVEDSDILRFIPTSLGNNTAGSFQLIFDGSDVELEADGEGIDSIAVVSDQLLVVSTIGSFVTGGASGEDEDLLLFRPTSFGSDTSGTWSLAFDGSDVGLSGEGEDIWGAWVDLAAGDVYLTTESAFAVDGSSGGGSDIFICHIGSPGANTSCTFGPGLYWQGAAAGFRGGSIDGFAVELTP